MDSDTYSLQSLDSEDSRPDVSLDYKTRAVLFWRKGYKHAEKAPGRIKRKRNNKVKINRAFSTVHEKFGMKMN